MGCATTINGVMSSNSALLTDAYLTALRAWFGAAKRERWTARRTEFGERS